ncbi:MAG TPA: VWA domain-containing protein [Thermoanaerobaculia bacterium]|nr:VWA domain-containing protein [Thermoanaerobaculia bacterium]
MSSRKVQRLVVVLTLCSTGASAAEPAASAPLADLPARYQQWLAEVAPLLDEKERAAFLGLAQDYRRDAFIRQFWQVRDPHPETARNELAEDWKERAQLARDRFESLDDERARVLLFLGEPGGRFEVRCSEVLLPLEVWRYSGAERVAGTFNLVFVRPYGGGGRFRIWVPGDGLRPLLVSDFRLGQAGDREALETIARECPRGDEVAGHLLHAVDWRELEARLVPDPGGEWVQTFLARSTDLPAGAAPLPARLELAFPARRQSRTIVQGVVTVPRAEARPERLGEAAVYTFVLDGEVVRKGELFDRFRVKFSLPEAAAGEAIPLVFERPLRPGPYRLVLRVEETASSRFFRDERDLEVPDVPAPAAAQAAPPPAGVPAPALPNAHPLLVEANAALERAPAAAAAEKEQSVRILPPPPGLLTGRARVEAIVAGDGVARVRWDLDGKPVLSKSRPPYSVELDLGPDPRLRRLAAVALGPAGEELAFDELQLNAGPHRFALRLVEPEPGQTYRESLRAQAQVEVPEGEKLDRVEFFLNDDRVATLYQAPFAQPLVLPPGRALTYVRAVAYLADGNATEDLVLVNAPQYGSAIRVDMVELYTTVVDRRGRPVDGLAREEFAVFEDGALQSLHRFEKVTDLPIYAGVLLDTSASMVEELDDAVKGALAFFQTVIQPKDRAAVVTFNDDPRLAVRFTSDPQVLAAGLAGVAAEGNTAFYDSLIFTLHYFGGLKGKRALIVLTDGVDEGSRYDFTDALEYARRSGVAIYPVGIGLGTKDADARMKLERLGSETGGRHFFIDRGSDLKRVYDQVEAELRTQYLLAYQSASEGTGNKYRSVEVKVKRPGLEAKTLRGYYP